MRALQSGILLQGGKYKIDKSLGQGGFGITYLAEQTNLNLKVCIKEFFMKEYGERTAAPEVDFEETVLTNGVPMSSQVSKDKDSTVLTGVSAVTSAAAAIMGRYREKFVKEAKTIAKLDHPGIVRIHDVFEENGTAYYVMDFIDGENLNELVKREGPLPEDRALGYIRQVADALSYVHSQKVTHLDVKPANIIIRKADDKAILIDFGAAKQYDSEGTQTSTTPISLSVGYAPIEMTKPGGVQTFSPETDVYSLGATLYFLVTGQNPPDASERMEMIMEGESLQYPITVSNPVVSAIEQCMQSRKKRIQTVEAFLESLPISIRQTNNDNRPGNCPNCGNVNGSKGSSLVEEKQVEDKKQLPEFRALTPKELTLFDIINRPLGILPVNRWGASMKKIQTDLLLYSWKTKVHKPWLLLTPSIEIVGYDMAIHGITPKRVEAFFPGKRKDGESALKLKRTSFVFYCSGGDILSYFKSSGYFQEEGNCYKTVNSYYQEYKTIGGKKVSLSLYVEKREVAAALIIDYGTFYGSEGIPFELF